MFSMIFDFQVFLSIFYVSSGLLQNKYLFDTAHKMVCCVQLVNCLIVFIFSFSFCHCFLVVFVAVL